MKPIVIPPDGGGEPSPIRLRRQPRLLTLLGGNGSGKSLFLHEIFRLNEPDAYRVSGVAGGMPAHPAGGVQALAERICTEESGGSFRKLKEIWEATFPGNHIDIAGGKPRITNRASCSAFGISKLSRGEKAALYYAAACLLAPPEALILVDSPELFLHPTAVEGLWERIENARVDCRFVYDTNDARFAVATPRRAPLWITAYDPSAHTWNYRIITDGEFPDEVFLQMMGSRRPILFTEGDATHSIDIRLYSAVFPEFTVKPLGSCDKVIESTRTMQSLRSMHRIESFGIVDRDRRSDDEVRYLREKCILVPEVAEIENIFLSPGVIETMALVRGRNPKKVLKSVRHEVMEAFSRMAEAQALQHTRHRMKRDVERKIDARFTCITALELHIKSLIKKLHPRETYERLLADFRRMDEGGDYTGVLRVFNHKPVFTGSCAPRMLGYANSDDYVSGVISTLRDRGELPDRLRREIRKLFS